MKEQTKFKAGQTLYAGVFYQKKDGSFIIKVKELRVTKIDHNWCDTGRLMIEAREPGKPSGNSYRPQNLYTDRKKCEMELEARVITHIARIESALKAALTESQAHDNNA